MKLTWFRDENNKMGLVDDTTDKIIISPKYDEISTKISDEGLIIARMGELYGAINIKNEIIIPFKYESLGDFSNGLSPVKINDYFGYINSKEEIKIPLKFKRANPFNCGLAVIETLDNKNYYINTKGEIMNPEPYNIAWDFNGGFAVISKEANNDKFNLINTDFETQFDKPVNRFEYINDSIYRVWIRNNINLIEEKAYDAKRRKIINVKPKYNNYWNEYQKCSNILKVEINKKIKSCYCSYPRILDLMKDKKSEEGVILLNLFYSNLERINNNRISDDKWIEKRKCKVCNSTYEFEIWEYRTSIISFKRIIKNMAKRIGKEPITNAPTYLNALNIEVNNRKENLNRINGNKLHKSSIYDVINYLTEKEKTNANNVQKQ